MFVRNFFSRCRTSPNGAFSRLGITLAVGLAFIVPDASAQSSFSFAPSVNRFAGTGAAGSSGVGGPALDAALHAPRGLAQDAAGNYFFADSTNNVIDRIDAISGVLTVFAGGGTPCSGAADAFGDGCPAKQATFNAPDHMAFDQNGNLYIVDTGNNLVREVVAATGMVVKVAGGGSTTCTGFTDSVGDGCVATAAVLFTPDGVAVDKAGNVYVSDSVKHLVRKIDATTKIISKWAGNGNVGQATDGGKAVSTSLFRPAGLALDAAGNMYIADRSNDLIRYVSAADGTMRTIAGTYTGTKTPTAGYSGDGGLATSATLSLPTSAAPSPSGSFYIADSGNDVLRAVDALGKISTVAGGGTPCSYGDSLGNGCAATQAKLNAPYATVSDANGQVVFTDTGNNELRRLSLNNEFGAVGVSPSTAIVQTLNATTSQASKVSNVQTVPVTTEFSLGTLPNCTGASPVTAGTVCGFPVSFAPKYPGIRSAAVLLTDGAGATVSTGVRGIGVAAQIGFSQGNASTVAGNGNVGNSNGTGAAATFNGNTGLTSDLAGNIFVADTGNNQIRRVDAASGVVTTVAGTGVSGYAGDGSAAATALLKQPGGVAFSSATGQLLIADTGNNAVRALNPDGTMSAVAGNGTAAFAGDGAAANAAQLSGPASIVADYAGNIYIADTGNNRIRRIGLNGIITTIAGTGAAMYTGDNAAATSATLNAPIGLAIDTAGNLYIADSGNHAVRRVQLATGIITTVAGNGVSGYTGDGSAASGALLNGPASVAVDASGNLFIADTGNHVIRAIDGSTGIITTVMGTGTSGYTGDGGLASAARLRLPAGVAAGPSGNIFVGDTGNDSVRLLDRSSTPSISFGAQGIGTTSTPQTVVVANTGNASLTFTAIAASAPFALHANPSGDCSPAASVAPGASCTLSVVFSPTSNVAANGTLTLSDNALNTTSTQIIPLLSSDPAFATSTTLTLTPSTSPVIYGTTVALGAAISASASNTNVFTGDIVLSDGTTEVGTVTTSPAGTASYALMPVAGAHSYLARFLGDANHGVSQSAAVPLIVSKAASSVKLTSTVTNARIGTSVTLTAVVSPQVAGTPTGTVTFTTAAATLGTVNLVDGSASYTSTNLPAGDNVITATYSGDVNFSSSASASTTVTIVIIPDFVVTAAPASIAIPAGQSGIVGLTITPSYNYAGTITLSCGTLPANVGCRFIPASLTATGTNTQLATQVLITTGGASASQMYSASVVGKIATAFLLGLLPLCLGRRRRSTFGARLLVGLFCVLALCTASGCGDAKTPSTPLATPATSTIIITAAGSTGSITHTSSITLKVQ